MDSSPQNINAPHQLVALNPSSVLTFKLDSSPQPRTVLRVTNVSGLKVAFKVKTTQPSWYYVRPNQQILDEGSSEDVVILMVEGECTRLLDIAAQGGVKTEEEKQHRFLVQSKVISEEEYVAIKSLSPSQKMDEISKLWEGPRDDRRNIKIKVEFIYPDLTKTNHNNAPLNNNNPSSAASSSSARPTTATNRIPTSVAENVELVRNKLARGGAAGGTTGIDIDASSVNNNPEVVISELQNLRKKYDAVVEYTVHLTAERDSIVSQLEVSQRELNKEKAKKKSDGSNNSSSGGGGVNSSSSKEKGNEKRIIQQGFSLFVVLITALIAFLLGKFIA